MVKWRMMKRMMKRYENIERARFEGVGDYDIPTLEKKTDFDPCPRAELRYPRFSEILQLFRGESKCVV